MGVPIDIHIRAGRSHVLARVATSGIYLLRVLPRDLQRAARARALSEGTTLRAVLLRGLREYAAGTWTPKLDRHVADATQPARWVATRPAIGSSRAVTARCIDTTILAAAGAVPRLPERHRDVRRGIVSHHDPRPLPRPGRQGRSF